MSRKFGSSVALATLAWGICVSVTQAQMFFEADAVFLDRSGGIGGSALINGSNPVSTSGLSTGFQSGYRLTFGGEFMEYQLDTSFTQVNPWQDSARGTLPNLVILDETFGPIVDPGGVANTIAFPNGVFDAATQPAELTESERLQGGAVWTYLDRANYRDFEVNLGTGRSYRPWRVAFGYRQIKYDGRSLFTLGGTFDAIDTDDAAVAGGVGNDANDILDSASILAAGFASTGMAADNFDSLATGDGPDILTYANFGQANNELNGAQTTFGFRMLDATWITLEGTAKAGIYQNNIFGRLTESIVGTGNNSSAYQRAFVDQKHAAAFAGNVGLRAIVSLTDYVNLTGGYELTFLTGLALAGDQSQGLGRDPISGNRFYSVRNRGDVLLHGGNVGLELNW